MLLDGNLVVLHKRLVINLNYYNKIDYVECSKKSIDNKEVEGLQLLVSWGNKKLYRLKCIYDTYSVRYVILEEDKDLTIYKLDRLEYTFWEFMSSLVSEYRLTYEGVCNVLTLLGFNSVRNNSKMFYLRNKVIKTFMDIDFDGTGIDVFTHYDGTQLNNYISYLYNVDLRDTVDLRYRIAKSLSNSLWYLIVYKDEVKDFNLSEKQVSETIIQGIYLIDEIIRKFSVVDNIKYIVLDDSIELKNKGKLYKINLGDIIKGC